MPVPKQLQRSESIRRQLDSPLHFRRMALKDHDMATDKARKYIDRTSSDGEATRNNIDIARDVAWAIKPEIDLVVKAREYEEKHRDSIRLIGARAISRAIRSGYSSRVLAVATRSAQWAPDAVSVVVSADLERNYENAVKIAMQSEELGKAALSGVTLEELSDIAHVPQAHTQAQAA